LDEKPAGLVAGKSFNIVSQLKSNRYLTIQGKNAVIKARDNSPGQLFMYDDKTQTISSFAAKNTVLDIADEGRARDVSVDSKTGKWWQQFNLKGSRLVNARGVVLDVQGGKDREGQNVIVWKKHSGLNQKWKIVYKDADTVQNGLIPNKPFRIISKMKSGRVITRIGNNNVVIRNKNDREEQIFVFDSKTVTIEPVKRKNLSLDIADWGHQRYVKFSNTKSIWHEKF